MCGPSTKDVARQYYTAIVPKDQDLFCTDHNLSTIEKNTPTVHAYPNPPTYLTDSLYIGEEGVSRLRVALHSTNLCKLDVFKHNYSVLNDLVDKAKEILENEMQPSIDMNSFSMKGFTGYRAMPLIRVFQADGALDQNITFLCTQIAALAFFLLSGADNSIFFRGCSGESYRLFFERTMYLLNIPVSNCSFALDYSTLTEDEAWIVKEITKRTGTMTDNQEAITYFNHQLSIAIQVKKRIQKRSTIVCTSSTSQAIGYKTVTGDDSIIEASTTSNSQVVGEETVTGDYTQPPIEYDEGYEFDRFF